MMMQKENSHAHLIAQQQTSKSNINPGMQALSDNDPANMSQQQHSVLNAFDFAAIDEMDPALGK
jgi:hypothetical protein